MLLGFFVLVSLSMKNDETTKPLRPVQFKKTFQNEKGELIEFLAEETKLSKSLLKKLLTNGAVWLKKANSGKRNRIRRATFELHKGSVVELYFDPKFLDIEIPTPHVLKENKNWGLWYKPAGMLSQGNNYGDQASLERFVEKTKGQCYLLHRLDREAHGIMLLAYNEKTARIFSEKFKRRTIKKFYQVEVLGDMTKEQPNTGDIEFELDGKASKTSYEILKVNQDANPVTTTLKVEIHTGRLHQIRRHFDQLDFPVMGDPKYGKNNKNEEGIKLKAYRLEFKDPFTQEWVVAELSEENTLKQV